MQELVLRVKRNIENSDEEALGEDLMAKDAEVFVELKKPCVHHLFEMPGNHSDFTSLLAHPCEWSLLFMVDEGAFLRTTIDYFKLVG